MMRIGFANPRSSGRCPTLVSPFFSVCAILLTCLLTPDAAAQEYYRLQLRHGGKYLDAVRCSDNVALTGRSDYDNGGCQLWRMMPAGGGWYRLQLKNNGKYLDAVRCSDRVALHPGSNYDGGSCQLWRFVPAGGGWSRLQLKHNGKYLDADHCSDRVGLAPTSDFENGACQLWRMVPVSQGPRTQAPAAPLPRKDTTAPMTAAGQCLSPPQRPSVNIPDANGAANSYQYTYEDRTNRPGGDYRNICNVSNAAACRDFCAADGRCQSWSWVKAGIQGQYPMCWLKSGISPKRSEDCCVSGVKELPDNYCEEPRTGSPRGPLPVRTLSRVHAFDVNLPGSDYRRICNVANDGVCMRMCDMDSRCQAWTWVRPGVQGQYPICYFKSSTPAEQKNNCCVSGHK